MGIPHTGYCRATVWADGQMKSRLPHGAPALQCMQPLTLSSPCTLNTIKPKLDRPMKQLPQVQTTSGRRLIKALAIIEAIFCNPLWANLPVPVIKPNLIAYHNRCLPDLLMVNLLFLPSIDYVYSIISSSDFVHNPAIWKSSWFLYPGYISPSFPRNSA